MSRSRSRYLFSYIAFLLSLLVTDAGLRLQTRLRGHALGTVTIKPPLGFNTTVNSTEVSFVCNFLNIANIPAKDIFYIDFLVNDTQIFADDEGFTTSRPNATTGILYVNALARYNNTNISCFVQLLYNETLVPLYSDTLKLLMQGPLASVGDLTATPLNVSSVQLTWTPPYTLDNVPIKGYHIDILNTTVNLTTNSTHITLPPPTDPDPCMPVYVSVTAFNEAGIGEPSYTTFYYENVTQKSFHIKLNPLNQAAAELAESRSTDEEFSFELFIIVMPICKGHYPSFAQVDILNSSNTVIKETLLSLQKIDNFTLKGNESIIIPANLKIFSVNVTLHNSAGAFPNNTFFQFSYKVAVNDINSHVQYCSLINITWEKNNIAGPGFVNFPIQYKLEILRDEQPVLELNVSNTSYQFEENNLFHHHYTYVITAVNKLGEGEPINETFTYQNQTIDGLIHNIQIKRYTETQVSLDLSIWVVSLCQNVGPLQIYLNIFCGDHKFELPFSNVFPSIKETVNNIHLPRHEHCHYNATIISNVSTTVTDLEVYNFSTFDVQSISVNHYHNLICITCHLISSSEEVNGCYVEGTTSKESWNKTLERNNSDSSTSTVRRCFNEPPVGNYTVYAYDLNGTMPLKEQPAASTTLNITSTSSSSFVSSPSANPTSSSSPPTKHPPNGLTIGLSIGIPIAIVLLIIIITCIVLGTCICYRRRIKRKKAFSINS